MKPYRCIINILLIALVLPSLATADLRDRVVKALSITNPGLSVDSVTDSQVHGVKEIRLSNGEYLYASPGGEHIFSGRLLAFSDDSLVDLTEERVKQERARMFQELDPGTLITFPATGEEKHEIFVFTDVSCGFCKRFHANMDELNERGITVNYLALPRSGITTPVADTMARVWCAENPQAAITEVKAGNALTQQIMPCRAPIADQYSMAQSLGVRGTPSVYSQDGRSLGGHMTPDEVIASIASTAGIKN
ncbi:DsbC family protein [Alcanivorax sp. JB21]|uniref:DsbC family protein n=1 Tax=Alcanivorax limicola TaxID=2874102 RepID=UPI001CBFCF40|nr:DsbC family protein [Alcanivorax limicola]MBZ2188523.1 DsbC family protein [Alcanivorax limicola]